MGLLELNDPNQLQRLGSDDNSTQWRIALEVVSLTASTIDEVFQELISLTGQMKLNHTGQLELLGDDG